MKRSVGICVLAVIVAACAGEPGTRSAPPAAAPSTGGASPSPPSQSPPAPTSATLAGVMDLLECDGPVSEVGGAGEEIALQTAGGRDPAGALEAFLAESPWVVPRTGYEPIASSGDRHGYGYAVDGEIKVVIVASPRFAHLVDADFVVDELRSCSSGEFGPEADFDDGRRTWTHSDLGTVIHDIIGPSHCGWESARLMHLQHPDGTLDRQYVRDPHGVLPREPLLDAYAEAVDLPADARDSGYRSPEGYELWFTDGDTAAYVVTPDGVERWPRAREPIGCA
jgi:hypothetical protein